MLKWAALRLYTHHQQKWTQQIECIIYIQYIHTCMYVFMYATTATKEKEAIKLRIVGEDVRIV